MDDNVEDLESLTAKNAEVRENLELPPKPEEPLPSDCCGSGCKPCVFDIYDKELKSWQIECEKLNNCLFTAQVDKGIASDQGVAVISKKKFSSFSLVAIERLNEDTCVYRFQIPENRSLEFRIGQHLILRSKSDGKIISRPYTLISSPNDGGFFDVMIKIYSSGLMSRCISKWEIGNKIEWRGPFGDFLYRRNQYKHISMLAAGTGIAPMFQLIKAVLDDENDETRLLLIYSCKKPCDLLMKSRLDEYKLFWNFQVIYCITGKALETDKDERCLKYGDIVYKMRIDEAFLTEKLPKASPSSRILICGTRSFDKDMINHVKKIGYAEESIFRF